MKKQTIASALTLVLAAFGCTGTDVGNGIVGVDVALYNERVEPGAAANGAIDVTNGWVSVTVFRLVSGADCADELELEVPAGVAINLFEPGLRQELASYDVPLDDYCEFRMKLDGFSGDLPTGSPPELTSSSIVLQGTRADGTEFILHTEQDEELIFEARSGSFEISETTSALFVGLDGDILFDGVDLDGAVVDGDDVIRVSPDSNQALLDVFESNLDAASKLYDDDDGDGDLDIEERDDDDVLGE